MYSFAENLIYGICILIVVVALTLFVVSIQVEKKCLDLGYANHKVTYTLEGYCIREENEYEITVPLRDLIEK